MILSWVACRWLTTRLDVDPTVTARLIMGGLAFATLMAAELGISTFAFGRSLADHVERYRELPTLLGLAGQIMFAIFPTIQDWKLLCEGATGDVPATAGFGRSWLGG